MPFLDAQPNIAIHMAVFQTEPDVTAYSVAEAKIPYTSCSTVFCRVSWRLAIACRELDIAAEIPKQF